MKDITTYINEDKGFLKSFKKAYDAKQQLTPRQYKFYTKCYRLLMKPFMWALKKLESDTTWKIYLSYIDQLAKSNLCVSLFFHYIAYEYEDQLAQIMEPISTYLIYAKSGDHTDEEILLKEKETSEALSKIVDSDTMEMWKMISYEILELPDDIRLAKVKITF